jgi:cold-inducible RNA-binding protein
MSVRLFVGGLSFSTSTERLREAFARYGGVDSAAVMTDRETGRSRGFGFVEMSSPEAAEQAIGALNGSSLDGRMIRVDKATPRGSAPTRSGGPDRRSSAPGPGGPSPGRRPPPGGGAAPRGPGDRSGARTPRPGGPAGGGRGPSDAWTPNAGDQRRGAGRRRDGEGQGRRAAGEGRRGSGTRRGGPGPQRRSGDRGRRSLGDDYRTF